MAKEEKLEEKEFKGKRKGKSFRKNVREPKPSKICMNDPKWYVVHPELLKDVASLSFPQWLGRGLTAPQGHTREVTALGLRYVYTLGVSTDANSPANLAVRNMYTFVRHANSGHTNYESPDLGLYLFNVGTTVASLAHIERLLGVAKYYQVKNAAVPSSLMYCLGCLNWSTQLVPNLANYTAKLNVLWARLSSICIPKDFKFIERWIWMNSQVFKDHESSKSQLLVFTPCGVPSFNSTYFTTGGAIEQPNYSQRVNYIDDWFNAAETAINNILSDEDMCIMSGDILKAYGEENLMKFGMTPLDYIVQPVFVEEMLPQIENARTAPFIKATTSVYAASDVVTVIPREVGIRLTSSDFANLANQVDQVGKFIIYQAAGDIICTPSFNYGAANSTIATDHTYWCDTALPASIIYGNVNHDLLLNSKHEVPTPEDVMISTRLQYTEKVEFSSSNVIRYIESCGTEIVVAIDVGARDLAYSANFTYYTEYLAASGAGTFQILTDIIAMSQFDWMPITYFGTLVSTPTAPVSFFDTIAGDIDNFTWLSNDRLSAMHLNAILGEFNVSNLNFIKG